ncbi:hypothetical protein CLV63_12645 [Murinocardiopsis flavida]|uniref:Cas3 C-terminal domain-containing protein n=1 Tax=Murinocardiopsis flavida TaxID=645275 RepID=A0A2P8CWU0_9ACTN|nr:hypothetical protein [Murinocardiopsis flavida]PSK89409.1 hypothetical protein CLV63_12645 [Murinocardiopsis flavida]
MTDGQETNGDEYDQDYAEVWFALLNGNGSDLPTTRSGSPVDLEAAELSFELVIEIVDENVVVLSAPVDLGSEALDVLCKQNCVPAAFKESGWLRDHHPLVLVDGCWEHKGIRVERRPDQSLRVTEPDTD